MKTSIEHLPLRKQEELRAVVEVLREGAPLGMLILFGSHARGDWVEDPEGGYFSDYDLLAIVESPKVADDAALWAPLEAKVRELTGEAAVTLIVHDLKFVNSEIRVGSYFFGDIRNEGIVLHDARRFALATPKEASPAERLERAERNFSYWFESASGFLKMYAFGTREGLKLAALGDRVRAFAAVVERVCQEKIASLRAAAEAAGAA